VAKLLLEVGTKLVITKHPCWNQSEKN